MRTRYLDYAMSVIIGRAIPDVRDGLKPVHRRILYSMHEQKPRPRQRRTRSARRVVGDVLGKYHPHGDAASTTRWSAWRRTSRCATRSSTARATSARSTAIPPPPTATPRRASRASRSSSSPTSTRSTSTSRPNFDDSRARADRPPVARSRTCSSTARAASPSAWRPTSRRTTWARSSTRPSHLIRNPDAPIDDLMRIVPGPDFPTGGLIYGRARHRAGAPHRPRHASSCARASIVEKIAGQAATASRSSSPRSPTR